jgi:hypothetical protein
MDFADISHREKMDKIEQKKAFLNNTKLENSV